MNIAIVLSATPRYSETFFQSKIKGLQEQGIDVQLYCQHKKDDFNLCPVVMAPKVTANPLLQGWYFVKESLLLLPYLLTVIRYIKIERKEKTGIVQTLKKIYLNAHILKAKLDWLHFGFATQALGSETVAKAIGANMAVSFRGFDIAVYPVKHPGCYTLLWKYIDKVHTISNDLLLLAKEQGLPEHIPVEKITPAIDVTLFQPSNQKGKKAISLTFITTGRLHWKKGMVQTLEALAILKDKSIDFMYKIIGEGKEYERIAFAAEQLGLKESVVFLGKIPHHQVKKELQKATLYLQYSIQEGFCNAVLEAQAMGKLCIVSNAEGLSENVLHGKTGWVVPKLEPKLFAEQIEKVVQLHEIEKKEITEYATDRVRDEFNIEKQQKEFVSFYLK